jgi:hypothetical protein
MPHSARYRDLADLLYAHGIGAVPVTDPLTGRLADWPTGRLADWPGSTCCASTCVPTRRSAPRSRRMCCPGYRIACPEER